MNKVICVFILLGVVCLPHAWADNKKNKGSSSGHAASAPHISGGGHTNGMASHQNFHANAMHNSNGLHTTAIHSETAHGLNASHAGNTAHGLNAQHGLNAAHGNFQGKGLNAMHNNGHFAAQNHGFNNHWHGAEHFHSYHDVYSHYHRQYHDRYWWHGHYDRIVIIGGGPYYWNAGYWYPAWGYDPAFTAYAYDGPIYSYDNLPPDQVLTNVQEALQDQGYYNGDVDGQLGPKTRDALGAYQQDHGLEVTSAVDEPTVDSLGLG